MDNTSSYKVMKTHDDFERSVWYRAFCKGLKSPAGRGFGIYGAEGEQ